MRVGGWGEGWEGVGEMGEEKVREGEREKREGVGVGEGGGVGGGGGGGSGGEVDADEGVGMTALLEQENTELLTSLQDQLDEIKGIRLKLDIRLLDLI